MPLIYPDTIIKTFDRVEKDSAKRSFVVSHRTVTYAEVCDTVRRLAGIYQSLGLKSGDSVVYATQDDMLASILFISLLRTGITAIFLDAETKPLRAQRLIELVEPKALILDESLSEFWTLPDDCTIVPIREHKKSIVNRLLRRKVQDNSLHGLLETTAQAKLPDSIDPSSTAYVLFTSGTTSDPKGVCITQHALFSHLYTLSHVYGLSSESKILNTLILSHVDGMIQGPILTFFNAACWYRPFRFSVPHIEDTLDTVFRERITHFIAVPTILSLLCRYGHAQKDSFQNGVGPLTISCGAQLEASLWKEFEDTFGHRIVNMYGLTETVTGGLFAGPDEESHQIGTIGKPVDCMARIVDENGYDVKPGDLGELLIKGDNVMSGYLKASEATHEVLRDGWFYTGDIAVQDDRGYYKIIGRKKAVIISGGINIHPGEINEVLNAHPLVAEAETFGEKDAIWGERVVSAVALTKDANVTEIDLMTYCREHLVENKIPATIHFLDTLPRGRSGKVQYEALREVVKTLKNQPQRSDSPDIEAQLLTLAAACFKIDRKELSLDSSEEDLVEWDSLGHLMLVAEVEKLFSITFSPAEVINARTLRDLYRVSYEKIRETA